jgi:hypothetical protein
VNQDLKTSAHIFLIFTVLTAITGCFAPTVLPIDPSNVDQTSLNSQIKTFIDTNPDQVLDAAESVLRAYRKSPKFEREAHTLTMVSSEFIFLVLAYGSSVEKWVIIADEKNNKTIATVSMDIQYDAAGPYAYGSSKISDSKTIDYERFWSGVSNHLNGLPQPICRKRTWVFEPLCAGRTSPLTEQIIKRLISIPVSRSEIIAVLGKPSRKMPASSSRKDISYLACETNNGYDLLNEDYPESDYYERKDDESCYELIFEFDIAGQMTGHRKETLINGEFDIPDGESVDYIHPLAESGLAPAQYLLYMKSGRKADYTVWLCRSADNGYAKAQIDVGQMYWTTPHIAQHRIKAYAWYKHAATGDLNKDLSVNKQSQARALLLMEEAEKVLTQEQLREAGNFYTEWKQGACEIDFPNGPYMN